MTGSDPIRYDLLVQNALKGVVRTILSDAARDGLRGDQHFYISFRTDFPGVRLSTQLRERYPREITIILQHQFWDLTVGEHAFEVGLSFAGVPERLAVPFEALVGFFDPSVQFGLKFEVEGDAAEPASDVNPPAPVRAARGAGSEPQELQPKPPALAEARTVKNREEQQPPVEPSPGEETAPAAEVVSLDAFRKKN
jgi:hypothetical protein